jgi:hypothetical protein
MNPSVILIFGIPLLVIGIGLTVRPLPLRVDATDPAERAAQHCQRISFLLLAIPAIVTGLVVALIIHKYSGGPGLLAYRSYLSIAGKLWKISSIVGILSGAAGSYFSKRRGQGYELVAVHAILLLIIIVAPYLQYAGHPD